MRRDLRSLSKENAEFVSAHLVAAGTLADEEPEEAWVHARAARARGGRIAVVRETAGLVAYRAGEWAEAISELRAARRMGGGAGHLPVMADAERALGHPERAIELGRSAEATELDEVGRLELRIVVAGARADLGQLDAALVSLRSDVAAADERTPGRARLLYAYADLLEQSGQLSDAVRTFMQALEADADEETDADERLNALADRLAREEKAAASPDASTADGQQSAAGDDTAADQPSPVNPAETAGQQPPAERDTTDSAGRPGFHDDVSEARAEDQAPPESADVDADAPAALLATPAWDAPSFSHQDKDPR